MAISGELLLEIDLIDFYSFLNTKIPTMKNAELCYGVPRVNISNQTLEVDVLFSEEVHPTDWVGYKETSVAKQWQELKQVTK